MQKPHISRPKLVVFDLKIGQNTPILAIILVVFSGFLGYTRAREVSVFWRKHPDRVKTGAKVPKYPKFREKW